MLSRFDQVWERKLDAGRKHDLTIDTSSVIAKPKTTKAKMAKLVLPPEELARKQKDNTIGVKMGKMRAYYLYIWDILVCVT